MLFDINADRDSLLHWMVIVGVTKMGIDEFMKDNPDTSKLEVKFTVGGHEMDLQHMLDRLTKYRNEAVENAYKNGVKEGQRNAIDRIRGNAEALLDFGDDEEENED